MRISLRTRRALSVLLGSQPLLVSDSVASYNRAVTTIHGANGSP